MNTMADVGAENLCPPAARRESTVEARVAAAALTAGALAILGVGAWLHPSATGDGTHTQLGLAPCGFLAITGFPCATCGMTTAVSHAAHGHLLAAFYTQPAGAAFALALAVAVILGFYSLISGVSLAPVARLLWRPHGVIALALFVTAAWVYKIILVRGVI